jgi:hypothetical protein
LRDLGFIDQNAALTVKGKKLADAFATACRPKDSSGKTMLPKSACLSKMNATEANLLADAMGINKKGNIAPADKTGIARRAALKRELINAYKGKRSVPEILFFYEKQSSTQLSFTQSALRAAGILERLSVGMNAIFLLWLHSIDKPDNLAELIKDARRAPRTRPKVHADIPIGSATAYDAMASIRRAVQLRSRGGDFLREEADMFALGEDILDPKIAVLDILDRLRDRHISIKRDEAWCRQKGPNHWELARDADDKWPLPSKSTLHGYRLDSFLTVLGDIKRARGGWI